MNTITSNDDLQKYNYTKIFCVIELKNNINNNCENYKSYFDICIDKFQQENCYIGLIHIEKFNMEKIKKLNIEKKDYSQWNLEIAINEAIKWTKCYDLVCDYCKCLSFFTSLELDINNSGTAIFTCDYFNLDVSYGINEGIFIAKALCEYAKIYGSETLTIKQVNTTLPKQQFDIDNISFFIEATSKHDDISKYILLYYFFEKIYESKDFKKAKCDLEKKLGHELKVTKYRAKILFYYLQSKRIYDYKCHFQTKNICEKDIEDIIITRNNIVHDLNTKEMHTVLYEKLLPIIKAILENSFQHNL
ncbi:hypothetical protein CLRAG_33650 [Clostridium ragsdalei P11]|uniref:Uncharacterized protein n=1 Tax=Clostridium ragsdalei P11 TaxID=1353534 RepID=A0A1A6AKV5_9CLOT|nr:hypothetical protein [Clostridium ragsdalei]OBR90717.1 hypothetical protein CLRAG_33650 [Clostridium ragsdalei P11]